MNEYRYSFEGPHDWEDYIVTAKSAKEAALAVGKKALTPGYDVVSVYIDDDGVVEHFEVKVEVVREYSAVSRGIVGS